MPKLFKSVLLISLILFFVVPCVFAAEEIILTTYYPSPYGSYNYLQTDKLGVGDNNADSAFTSADVPTDSGEVWIKGDVGIGTGTAGPGGKLDVKGGYLALDNGDYGSTRGIRFRNTTDTTTPGGGGIYEANNNNLYVQSGSGNYIWLRNASGTDLAGLVSGKLLLPSSTQIAPSAVNSITALQIADYSGSAYVDFDSTNKRVGIATAAPGYTLSVAGTIWANGSTITAGATTWSDIRLKENIAMLNNCLNRALKLNGIYYTWKENEFTKNFPKGRQIGIIAQEVEKEFPELVTTDKNGYKTVAYDKFTAVLLEAIRTQQDEIVELRNELESIKAKLKK